MTPRVKKLYHSALNNTEFLQAIYEADGDVWPIQQADDADKVIFAICYFGWLVAKYGKSWKLNL